MNERICPYCGTACATREALEGHMPLCDHNPANGGKVKKAETVVVLSDAPAVATTPEPDVQPGAPAALVFGGKVHPGETPEEVIKTDRTYIELAASLYRDPAIKQRCKELLMVTPK